MSGADLSRLMVQSYILDDQRILDPAARAEFMRGGSPMGGFFDSSVCLCGPTVGAARP